MLFEASIRRFVRRTAGDTTLRLTEYQSLAMAQVEPEFFELARSGRVFYGGGQNGATGRAPVTAMPTTAAAWMMWNGEPDGGRALVPLVISLVQISGTAAVGGCALFALTTTKIAKPTAATGYSSASQSAGGRSSKAVWADDQTLDETPVWGALEVHGHPATTTIGGVSAQPDGRIVVPPGYALAMNHLSGTGTTPLLVAHCIWAEIEAELE